MFYFFFIKVNELKWFLENLVITVLIKINKLLQDKYISLLVSCSHPSFHISWPIKTFLKQSTIDMRIKAIHKIFDQEIRELRITQVKSRFHDIWTRKKLQSQVLIYLLKLKSCYSINIALRVSEKEHGSV